MAKTKLQVPIDRSLYERLRKQANELGFDSVQAYVRFWAKAVTTAAADKPAAAKRGLADPAEQALRYLELVLSITKPRPASLEDALDSVVKELNRVKAANYLGTLLKK